MPKDSFPLSIPRPSVPARFVRAQGQDTTKMILHPLTAGEVSATATKCRRSTLRKPRDTDAVRENMLVLDQNDVQFWTSRRDTVARCGWRHGRNLHIRAQLELFERIGFSDICPELLEIGQENARNSFTASQCKRIHWVCLDINSKDINSKLATHLGGDKKRGFDTISFSYSLSMIPEWEKALLSAKSLMSKEGRVIVSDFDTYTEQGKSIKDYLIRSWYAHDGVRIEAKSRHFMTEEVFPADKFTVTIARFQRKLMKVPISHYVVCMRKAPLEHRSFRRPSMQDLTVAEETKKSS
jgi:hypothetical protein